MYIEKKFGPRTKTCDTPLDNLRYSERDLTNLTNYTRFWDSSHSMPVHLPRNREKTTFEQADYLRGFFQVYIQCMHFIGCQTVLESLQES